MLDWTNRSGVAWHGIAPGKPVQDAFESFNDRFPAECLSAHWFLSLADAREKVAAWRRDDNEVRPHGAIGDKPPIAQPASRRDEARKLQPRVIQRTGSLHRDNPLRLHSDRLSAG